MIRFTAWGNEVTYHDGEFVTGNELVTEALEAMLRSYPPAPLLTKDQIAKAELSHVEWLGTVGVDIEIIENRPDDDGVHRP